MIFTIYFILSSPNLIKLSGVYTVIFFPFYLMTLSLRTIGLKLQSGQEVAALGFEHEHPDIKGGLILQGEEGVPSKPRNPGRASHATSASQWGKKVTKKEDKEVKNVIMPWNNPMIEQEECLRM